MRKRNYFIFSTMLIVFCAFYISFDKKSKGSKSINANDQGPNEDISNTEKKKKKYKNDNLLKPKWRKDDFELRAKSLVKNDRDGKIINRSYGTRFLLEDSLDLESFNKVLDTIHCSKNKLEPLGYQDFFKLEIHKDLKGRKYIHKGQVTGSYGSGLHAHISDSRSNRMGSVSFYMVEDKGRRFETFFIRERTTKFSWYSNACNGALSIVFENCFGTLPKRRALIEFFAIDDGYKLLANVFCEKKSHWVKHNQLILEAID